ncbi:hypothetical protein [Rugosimonospora africana]|uniref:Aldolase n=1 Tax=Rugosimonospora africana TaxID=556532 RepID=A0A8J3QU77_9ACTN|nr:hypothetical protein [Rugosimonospora africana]GIH16576.1 aldolase [Rugosimonospora africana]
MSRSHRTADASATDELTAPLRAAGGGFAMLALDQRESLRRMFPLVNEQEVGDDALRGFKSTAGRILAPLASAVLLDRPYAVTHARPEGLGATSLILAADVLEQPAGQPVVATTLDPAVTPEFIRRVGAAAVKFLVIWRPDGRRAQRAELIGSFLAVARAAGVASLVEAIAEPAGGGGWASPDAFHAAVLDAAREISPLGATIYKAQVPGYLPGDFSRIREHAERMTDIVPVPWVVLSNGVDQSDFAPALRNAVLGGAQGFLAGRAIWRDTVSDPDPAGALTRLAARRLNALTVTVAEALRSRGEHRGGGRAPGPDEATERVRD